MCAVRRPENSLGGSEGSQTMPSGRLKRQTRAVSYRVGINKAIHTCFNERWEGRKKEAGKVKHVHVCGIYMNLS